MNNTPEIEWRNMQLLASDWIVQTPDHPQRAPYITYRQALRDWPAQADFATGARPAL